MKMKKKFMKTLAISMAFSMLFCNSAFATEIDLVNSTESVATDTLNKTEGTDYFIDEINEWSEGTINEEVRVTVDLASQFEITIPKEIVLDGETGKADYKVKAVGDIAGDQKLSVVPDPDFVLSEAGGKADVVAIVTQANTEYVYTDLQGDGTEYDGSIAATLTAGEWSGKFNFNINFEGGESNTHICNTDGRNSTSLFTLFEGMDDNLGIPLPLYNTDMGDGNYMTIVRYDTTIEKEQTISINYDVNTTGVFMIASDVNTSEPELGLISPGQTSSNVEINLKKGSNSIYIVMNAPSIDDNFSIVLEGTPCCSICGHIHEYNKEDIIKKATCTEEGIKTYTCECGDYYEEDIERLPHTIVNGGTKEAHTKCNICNNILSSIHKFTSKTTKEPTCTELGIKTYTCECGYSYTNDIAIDLYAHNYIDKVCEYCNHEIPEVKNTLNEYTWEEISAISKSGEAQTTYGLKVGDTKEMTLSNGETYNVEIIGFNHDDLADGSGTAGITFQFKEVMTTTYTMNFTNTNAGGWGASEMRTYVNNDVFALLPADLQAKIKTVDKISDVGNGKKAELIHTSDKLFLLSFEEAGLQVYHSTYFAGGQGKQYEKFAGDTSRIKSYLSGSVARWWLRSAYTGDIINFFFIGTGGSCYVYYTDITPGVAPAFCI